MKLACRQTNGRICLVRSIYFSFSKNEDLQDRTTILNKEALGDSLDETEGFGCQKLGLSISLGPKTMKSMCFGVWAMEIIIHDPKADKNVRPDVLGGMEQ